MRVISTFAACSLISMAAFAQGQRPTTDVNVSNTPGVTVENTANVNVENDASSPVPVSIVEGEPSLPEKSVYQIVGFTMVALPGDIGSVGANDDILGGVRAMNRLCQSQVAENTRAASVEDLQRTAGTMSCCVDNLQVPVTYHSVGSRKFAAKPKSACSDFATS